MTQQNDGRPSPGEDPSLALDCACGNRLTVFERQAGVRLDCPCGRTLQVPNLHELRMRAGLTPFPVSTANQLKELAASGELPPGTTCAGCSRPTAGVLGLVAVCERRTITVEE